MKIWIHINGVQEGPFDESNLPLDRMNAATPVWYEGLNYWMPAAKAPVTAQILTNYMMQASAPRQQENPQPQATDDPIDVEYTEEKPHAQQSYNPSTSYQQAYTPSNQQTNNYHQPTGKTPSQQPDKKPATYLIWSILLTVMCCNPIGIIPIITGTQVTSQFKNYNFEGARKCSELTEWWLMITIVTSLMLAPISMLMFW